MWNKWLESPPCIPTAPIMIPYGEDRNLVLYSNDVKPEQRTYWIATGLYREEYYSVTGSWE